MTSPISPRASAVLGPLLLIGLLVPLPASAGGTQVHRVSDFDDFDKGEVDGAAIEKPGRVTVGYQTAREELEASSVFTCVGDGNRAFVGTASEAAIHAVTFAKDGTPKVSAHASLEGVVVSALAKLPNGDLVAGVLPGGTLYRVDKKGKVSTFAELKGVEHVWAIVPHEGRLLIGTGPKGELWSVDTKGNDAKVVLDIDERDVLSVLSLDGRVLVGSSPKARLYQLGDDTEGILVHDFNGDEIKSLQFTGRNLLAAVNDFEDRGLSSRESLEKQLALASLTGKGTVNSTSKATVPKAEATLYRVDLGKKRDLDRASDAAWETWLKKEKQYFTSVLPVDDRGTVLVSSSQAGKVYRVRGQRSIATVADLEERQATTLCSLGGGRVLAGAGDGAAVYNLRAAPSAKARYTTEVLDASQPADYGAVVLQGDGPLNLRVRTGPSDEPDGRWSAWKTVGLAERADGLHGRLDLPRRRYAQLEVELRGRDSELRNIELFYAPENLAPLLTSIEVAAPKFDLDDDDEPDAETKIKWKAEARDDDELVYEVSIRPEGDTDGWVRINDDPTEKKELALDLETLPDGVYEVEIRATDEPSNGSARARSDKLRSDPFVVDRTRPEIADVKVVGQRVTGTARDRGSRVNDVSWSVDGGPFRSASPSDGLYDSETERFVLELPDTLEPGRHRLVIRARDGHGNLGNAGQLIER